MWKNSGPQDIGQDKEWSYHGTIIYPKLHYSVYKDTDHNPVVFTYVHGSNKWIHRLTLSLILTPPRLVFFEPAHILASIASWGRQRLYIHNTCLSHPSQWRFTASIFVRTSRLLTQSFCNWWAIIGKHSWSSTHSLTVFPTSIDHVLNDKV